MSNSLLVLLLEQLKAFTENSLQLAEAAAISGEQGAAMGAACIHADLEKIQRVIHMANNMTEVNSRALEKTINDTHRLDHLASLIEHCPHVEIAFNDDPEDEQLRLGWTIIVEGCERSEINAPVFRECIDKEIMAASRGEWPKHQEE